MDIEEALAEADNERARLAEIDKSCGLLKGALARVMCRRGHRISTHPTRKHRER